MSRVYNTHFGYLLPASVLSNILSPPAADEFAELLAHHQFDDACEFYNDHRPSLSYRGLPAVLMPEAVQIFTLGARSIGDDSMTDIAYVRFVADELYELIPTHALGCMRDRGIPVPEMCSWVTLD